MTMVQKARPALLLTKGADRPTFAFTYSARLGEYYVFSALVRRDKDRRISACLSPQAPFRGCHDVGGSRPEYY